MEFSSDRAPGHPSPRAGGPDQHQRRKVVLWRLQCQIIVESYTILTTEMFLPSRLSCLQLYIIVYNSVDD